jgi:hypothetical protein
MRCAVLQGPTFTALHRVTHHCAGAQPPGCGCDSAQGGLGAGQRAAAAAKSRLPKNLCLRRRAKAKGERPLCSVLRFLSQARASPRFSGSKRANAPKVSAWPCLAFPPTFFCGRNRLVGRSNRGNRGLKIHPKRSHLFYPQNGQRLLGGRGGGGGHFPTAWERPARARAVEPPISISIVPIAGRYKQAAALRPPGVVLASALVLWVRVGVGRGLQRAARGAGGAGGDRHAKLMVLQGQPIGR